MFSSYVKVATTAVVSASILVAGYITNSRKKQEIEFIGEIKTIELIGDIVTGTCPGHMRKIPEHLRLMPKHLADHTLRRQFKLRKRLHELKDMEYFHERQDRSKLKHGLLDDSGIGYGDDDIAPVVKQRKIDTTKYPMEISINVNNKYGCLGFAARKKKQILRARPLVPERFVGPHLPRAWRPGYINGKCVATTNPTFVWTSPCDTTYILEPRVTKEKLEQERRRQQRLIRLASGIVTLPSSIATFNEDGAILVRRGRGMLLD